MAEITPVEIVAAPIKPKVYEAMFMLTQQQAALLGESLEHIFDIIARSGAEIVAAEKWDERRLAYEIDKQKRAAYILIYIRCEGSAVAAIEREVNLSERILRLMVVTADHLTDEEIAAHDQRDALMAEAKMRAERGAEDEQKSSGVRLGAPEPEAPEDGGGENEGASADAATASDAPSPAAPAGIDTAPSSESADEPARTDA